MPQVKSINPLAFNLFYDPTLTSKQNDYRKKIIALATRTFVGKVMSLLFKTLSRFVTAFLPWRKHLLILWLQSPSAVILEPKKMKSDTVSTFSPPICHEVIGPDAIVFVFLLLMSLAKNIKQEMCIKMRYNIIIFI